VLPHFEHQLGLGAEPVSGSLSNESLHHSETWCRSAVPRSLLPGDASTRHLTVLASGTILGDAPSSVSQRVAILRPTRSN
jgi:hypothetical protein